MDIMIILNYFWTYNNIVYFLIILLSHIDRLYVGNATNKTSSMVCHQHVVIDHVENAVPSALTVYFVIYH